MISRSAILSTAERFDAWLPALPQPRAAKSQRLVILLVHTLYHRQCDAEDAGVYPHERMTVSKFRQFLECFLERGFTFLSPADIQSSSRLPDKAMMLTFDDGYFNFVHALPVLSEFQTPATLCVCPGYVANSQSFWWDAFYRHARAGGGAEAAVRREMSRLRKMSFDGVYRLITDRWGRKAMQFATDMDRPLSLDELKDIARDPLVHLGNHTYHHAALPFQCEAGIRREIRLADEFFAQELGERPKVISYPNGDYGDSVIDICRRLGYELGMTIEACWNSWDNTDAD
jgi:peptidoglycan/xylan/chitin deacetylase (PgdA/CDA1 family)